MVPRSRLSKTVYPRLAATPSWSVVLLAALAAHSAHAQEAAGATQGSGGRSLTVVPRISITETWSNNVSLQAGEKQSDFTTQISPGINVSSNAGRLRGFFDYSLNQLLYARNSDKNSLQNALNTSGTYEFIDNQGFLEFSGTISQQSISAFGLQSPSNASINSNRTEVATYRLSPYFKGRVANFADYEARYSVSTSRSKSSLASDTTTQDGLLRLSGDVYGRFRWSGDLTHQNVDYSEGRRTQSDRLNTTLTYSVNSQFNAALLAGEESSNYTSTDKESHGSVGASANWRPSPATNLSAEIQRRYFGTTHTFSFDHRTARTAWSISDNRSVSTSPNSATAGLGGLYDLLFSQFAVLEPDPIKRAQLVVAYLQANGLDPRNQLTGGYLTSGLSLQRTQSITFALLGVRDTITFSGLRSSGRTLSSGTTTTDDFANSGTIRQNGLNVNYTHRLTPDSNVSLMVSQQNSAGDLGLGSKQRLVNLGFSTRLGLKTFANVSARRTISSGEASGYSETAVTGTLNVQF